MFQKIFHMMVVGRMINIMVEGYCIKMENYAMRVHSKEVCMMGMGS